MPQGGAEPHGRALALGAKGSPRKTLCLAAKPPEHYM